MREGWKLEHILSVAETLNCQCNGYALGEKPPHTSAVKTSALISFTFTLDNCISLWERAPRVEYSATELRDTPVSQQSFVHPVQSTCLDQ